MRFRAAAPRDSRAPAGVARCLFPRDADGAAAHPSVAVAAAGNALPSALRYTHLPRSARRAGRRYPAATRAPRAR
ncbi:hypothetical protein C7S16_5736 [Burkholderia thailandensis]|uniref:Uncharacterized protein n=1 Tax=Burkholderia thailandensis TaxID=57975 RepID=A0AAW9CSG5_BURTH|nr:hypothetical protein [Burkholderia thailandensis]